MMLKLVLLVICPIPGCAHLPDIVNPQPHMHFSKKKTVPQLNEQAQFDNLNGLVEGDP